MKKSTRIILNCPRIMKRWFAAALACVVAAACGGAPITARRQVRVAAASDLNVALPALIAQFTQSHAVDVVVSYGSSGAFYSQLLNQAPFDLFFSADVDYPHQLASRGLVVDGSEFVYGIGRLVLWVPSSSGLDLARGLQALAASAVSHVSIANPQHAPYGRAAAAAL